MSALAKIVILPLIVMLSSCSKPASYRVAAVAVSEQGTGVVLNGFPITHDKKYYSSIDLSLSSQIRVHPMIPNEYSNFTELPPFEGFEQMTLPESISFSYQYAKLDRCGSVYEGHPKDLKTRRDIEGSPIYYTKSNCNQWSPIPGTEFRTTIDLSSYLDSPEMQRLGKHNDSASGSKYGARVIFEFYDNGEIKIRLENTTSNPWK